MLAICFNTDVGTGSADDDLSRRKSTDSVDHVVGRQRTELLKADTAGGKWVNVGAGASAVLDRTLATFSAKKPSENLDVGS